MVLKSQWDGQGSASQAPEDCTSGTRGTTDVTAVGQRSRAQGPDSEGSASRRTLLPTGERRWGGAGVSRLSFFHLHPCPLEIWRKRKLLFLRFWNRTQKGNKDSPPSPLSPVFLAASSMLRTLPLFHCMVRYGTVRHGSVRYGTAQFGSVCLSTAV